MYNIGIFLSDWNYGVVESLLQGFQDYTDAHEEVRTFVFNDFGVLDRQNKGREDMVIFSVPEISSFDAVILEGDRGWPSPVRLRIINEAKEHKIPVISINNPRRGCVYVGTDNYSSMKDMTEHVLRVHGCREIAFLRGRKHSGEADERERGFDDACREFRIPYEHIRKYDSDWFLSNGRRIARKILTETPLPDAVICSNDDTAVGAAEVFLKAGLRIPDDIIITGFDNTDIAEYFEPRITSVERDYRTIAETGIQVAVEILEGKRDERPVYCPHELLFTESCGCGDKNTDQTATRKRLLQMSQYLRQLYRLEYELLPVLNEAKDLVEIMPVLEENLAMLQSRNVFIVLNSSFLWNYNENLPEGRAYSDRMVLMTATGEAARRFSPEPDSHIYGIFDRKELLPGGLLQDSGMLIFYPLQCSRSVIGYLVMDRMSPVSEFNMLDIILTLLANNIDMVQEKSVMAGRNEVLQELYRHDSLTGLYNRFGMENTGAEYCRKLTAEGKKYYFYFIDMDGLKKINDKHGHDAGDWALRLMADSLRNVCGENGDFCMRYGGDEFLAIGTVSVGSMRKKLEKELKKQVKISGCTLDLSFSLGGFAAEKGTEENLRDAIKRADKEMYVVKQKKKKGKDKKEKK